jgi:transcription termination factor NusB
MAHLRKPAQPAEARSGAYEILKRVEQGGYADLLLDAYLERNPGMDPRERGLLTELVYGVLRLRGRLDFALERFSRQPLARLEADALLLLRLGAYQLLELDRIPAHAAVHATVDLAHRIGMGRVSGLVNGTLRALERERTTIPWPTPDHLRAYLQHVCSLPVSEQRVPGPGGSPGRPGAAYPARQHAENRPRNPARGSGRRRSQRPPLPLRSRRDCH